MDFKVDTASLNSTLFMKKLGMKITGTRIQYRQTNRTNCLQLQVSGWNKKIRMDDAPSEHQMSTTKLHGVTSNTTINFDSIVVWQM